LVATCKLAEKRIPNVSDWGKVLDEITYANDGREAFNELAADLMKTLPAPPESSTAEEFIDRMAQSKQARARESELSVEEIAEDIAGTQTYADRYAALLKFDSIAVLAPREGWSRDGEYAKAKLIDAMGRRVRLQCHAALVDVAEEELVMHLQVLRRLDADSSLRARMWVHGEVSRILIEMVEGALRPLAGRERVESALESLFEHGNTARKRAWLREFKYAVAYFGGATRAQLMESIESYSGNRTAGLKRAVEDLACELDIATAFDSYAPDLLDTGDYTTARGIAKSRSDGVTEKLCHTAYQEVRWKAAWLGYRLYLASRVAPLDPADASVKAITEKYSGVRLEWLVGWVVVRVDPELPAAIDTGYSDAAPVVTIAREFND
jgi:hypothetical protein